MSTGSKKFHTDPVGGVVADRQDDLAKLSSLNKQVNELYQAGKFNEAVPVAQKILELIERSFFL